MEPLTKKINILLKQCKSKQFKSWNKIDKGIKKSRILESNSTASRGKSFLMSELKPDWFMQASDYSSCIYYLVCNLSDMEKESLSFWENLSVHCDWQKVINFQDGRMELNIPYLYEKTLEDSEQRKIMRHNFDNSQNIRNECKRETTSEFDKALHKYIKCLSKRKSDLIKKLNRTTIKSIGNDLPPETEFEGSTHSPDIQESPEEDVFSGYPIEIQLGNAMEVEREHIPINEGLMDENVEVESIQIPKKQINKAKLEEYQNLHPFLNWDEITFQLSQNFQTIDNSEQTHKKFIKFLQNKWFITQKDIDLESNTVSYFVNEGLSQEAWWQVHDGSIPFANISNGELRINIPKLFLQSKEKKNQVKKKSENLFSEEYSRIIDSMAIQIPSKSIEELLNTFIKRLFKRKNDFVNSIIKESIQVGNEGTLVTPTLYLTSVHIIPSVQIIYLSSLPILSENN